MKTKFLAICLVLVVAIAATGLSCEKYDYPAGKIEVHATFCGEPWSGSDVAYYLSRDGIWEEKFTGVPNYTAVNAHTGTYLLQKVSGGPSGAYLDSITPSPTLTLTEGGTITFTLNFKLPSDPGIDFLTWTINGEPVEPNEPEEPYELKWGDIIDVHFEQHVSGCEGAMVEVMENSELLLHYGEGPPAWVALHVLDDPCALEKDPEPVEQVSRNLFVDGDAVEHCMSFDLIPDEFNVLKVETRWKLAQCTEYKKKINWLRIGDVPEPVNGECVLFELLFDSPGVYLFKLVASAEVGLVWQVVDVDDPDTENNSDESPPLYVVVLIGL